MDRFILQYSHTSTEQASLLQSTGLALPLHTSTPSSQDPVLTCLRAATQAKSSIRTRRRWNDTLDPHIHVSRLLYLQDSNWLHVLCILHNRFSYDAAFSQFLCETCNAICGPDTAAGSIIPMCCWDTSVSRISFCKASSRDICAADNQLATLLCCSLCYYVSGNNWGNNTLERNT
jgi:hypothetical protein